MSQAFVKKKRLDIDGVLLLDKPAGISSNDALTYHGNSVQLPTREDDGTGATYTIMSDFRQYETCLLYTSRCV